MKEKTKEFRIKISVRNNLIIKKIEELGFNNVSEFARQNKININRLNALICFKFVPLKNDGAFRSIALQLMEALCCLPEDLWTQEQLYFKAEKSTHVYEAEISDIQNYFGKNEKNYLGAEDFYQENRHEILEELLNSLPEKEEKVLRLSFGIGNNGEEKTHVEISKIYGVTKERIRQIQNTAMRRIRYRASLKGSEILSLLQREGE